MEAKTADLGTVRRSLPLCLLFSINVQLRRQQNSEALWQRKTMAYLVRQILYRNKRTTGLSRLETLPSFLLRKIYCLLDDELDEICLSLTSKGLAAVTRQLRARGLWCSRCRDYHDDDDAQFYDWYELAMRLQDSMPELLQFCHHCLVFLPTLCFGPPVLTIDTLVCLDCMHLRVPRRPSHLIDCIGCLLVQERLDEEEEGPQESRCDRDSLAPISESSLCGEDAEDQEGGDAEDHEERYVDGQEQKDAGPNSIIVSSGEPTTSLGLTNAGAACLCM
jgi:hypothetical protein